MFERREHSCCLGLKLLSGIERSVHFTIVRNTKGSSSICPLGGVVPQSSYSAVEGGGTAGQHNKRKTNHHSLDGFSRMRLDNTGRRNTERWYQLSLIAAVTFTADLSTMCHRVQLCHLSVTFFSILVCWAIYDTVKHHRPSSLHQPLCSSVQLVGSIRRWRARLTEVKHWHIAGHI